MANLKVATSNLLLINDAKSPVPFERNTVLGRLLSMAGGFEVPAMMAASERSLDLAQRDPTDLLEE